MQNQLSRRALIGAALASAMIPTAATARGEPPLRVMSFNIRLPIDKEPGRSWETRRSTAIAMIRRAAPDIIGTQELHKRQGDDIVAGLPNYNWFGIDRKGGRTDEFMGLFYRRDRLKLLEQGNFWLSDTPEVPGSMTWGNIYPRMVTWGLFETIAGKRRFYAYNTHLPYRPEDEAAREKGAALIAARLAALPANVPVVLTGDFNIDADSTPHRLLSQTLSDAWLAAPVRSGPAETFHNFTGKADRRIDWIFTRGFAVRRAATLTDHHGTVQTSDHFPVVAELGWR